jgi:hypothetical protein
MNKQLRTTATQSWFLAASVAVLATLTIGVGGTGYAQDGGSRPGPLGYTVLDHPAKPCNLSVEAVANWGETSAHLPQACTYDD